LIWPPPIGNYSPINSFPLQPGSDYATIDTDFTQSVATGSLSFGVGQTTADITVPISNDGIAEFNEDMNLQIYNATPVLTFSPGGNPPWRVRPWG